MAGTLTPSHAVEVAEATPRQGSMAHKWRSYFGGPESQPPPRALYRAMRSVAMFSLLCVNALSSA